MSIAVSSRTGGGAVDCVAVNRMTAFHRIRDWILDIRFLSAAAVSCIKLLVGTMFLVNLLAGAWYVRLGLLPQNYTMFTVMLRCKLVAVAVI